QEDSMARIVTGLLIVRKIREKMGCWGRAWPRVGRLMRPDGYDGVHAGGNEGGNDAGQAAGEQTHEDGQNDDVQGNEYVKVQHSREDERQHEYGRHADQAADDAKEGGFEQELHQDRSAFGADGFLQPDLGSSFADGDEHDIRNAEHANDERKGGDGPAADIHPGKDGFQELAE